MSAEDAEWIGGAVGTLLSFYFVPDEDPRVVAAQGRLWVEDLRGFPRQVIEAALRDWRRNETRRPTPADIIALCRRGMPKPRPVTQLERAVPPEQRAKAKAVIGDFLQTRRIP